MFRYIPGKVGRVTPLRAADCPIAFERRARSDAPYLLRFRNERGGNEISLSPY